MDPGLTWHGTVSEHFCNENWNGLLIKQNFNRAFFVEKAAMLRMMMMPFLNSKQVTVPTAPCFAQNMATGGGSDLLFKKNVLRGPTNHVFRKRHNIFKSPVFNPNWKQSLQRKPTPVQSISLPTSENPSLGNKTKWTNLNCYSTEVHLVCELGEVKPQRLSLMAPDWQATSSSSWWRAPTQSRWWLFLCMHL